MESLKKYYNSNQRNSSLLDKEYVNRKDNAVKLPFTIHTKDKKDYQLYFNITNDLMEKIFDIKTLNQTIVEKCFTDKELANFSYNELIKNEIDYTNQIENIRTSRKNIDLVQKKILAKNLRIDEYKLVENYNKIIKSELQINTIEELSAIYKEILEDYLDENDKLEDKCYFRNDDVSVIEGANKIVHQAPVFSILEEEMSKLLTFLNEAEDVNIYIRVAIWHFYFGYLHPYFDGNGRMNRFVSVYKLYSEMEINSFILSKQLMENRDIYYKMFEETEDMFNRGDLNYFIYNFIYMIEQGLRNFLIDFEIKQKRFKKIYAKLKGEFIGQRNSNRLNIIFYFIRIYEFDADSFCTKQELCKIFNLSESAIRVMLDLFEEEGKVLKEKEGKTFIYKINKENDFIKEILDNE